uniref:Uncharacterized protein n=1 Tax=Oryza brachyantha TaxID=4533 RepID=J3L8P7_ORYBR
MQAITTSNVQLANYICAGNNREFVHASLSRMEVACILSNNASRLTGFILSINNASHQKDTCKKSSSPQYIGEMLGEKTDQNKAKRKYINK